jgi:tetratricopeptide (TPR) repeat protein
MEIMMDIAVRLQLGSEIETPQSATGYIVESQDVSHWIALAIHSCSDATQCDFFPLLVDGVERGAFLRISSPMRLQVRVPLEQVASVIEMRLISDSTHMNREVWIPLAGKLLPEPLAAEWDLLLADQKEILVWHPMFGLLGFDRSQRCGIESLIQIMPLPARRWSDATEGTALPERLIRVDGPAPPTLQQWLANTEKNIGKNSGELLGLSPSQAERRGNLADDFKMRFLAALGKSISKVTEWMARAARNKNSPNDKPVNSSAPAKKSPTQGSALSTMQWAQQIREWAKNQMQQWSEALEARRNASVNRLLEMLATNPDDGLKYAIPMSDVDAMRGMGKAGSELVAHDWRSAGSGGGDAWSVNADLRSRLLIQYRQLALREFKNGRFERAAFIYAHLMGDYSSAANALEQGKLYRSAAVIYRDRLRHQRKAAELFRLAGDFDETLILYKTMGMHLEAGDLYRELDQNEKAVEAYRCHVEYCISRSRWCDAADTLVDKLDATDEAIAMLQRNWPFGHQGEACFEKTISILFKADRHDDAIQQIDRLVKTPSVLDCGSWPAQFLAKVVQAYPVPSVQNRAQQALYLYASQVLSSTNHGAHHAGVSEALRRAIPEDSLLHRDTWRYLHKQNYVHKQNEATRDTQPTNPLLKSVPKLEPILSIPLNSGTKWFGMIPTLRGPLCFGEHNGTLIVQPGWFESGGSGRKPSEHASMQLGGGFEIRSFFTNVTAQRWIRSAGKTDNGNETFLCFIGGSSGSSIFREGSTYWYDGALSFRVVPANPKILDCFVPPALVENLLEGTIVHEQGVLLEDCDSGVRLGLIDRECHISYPKQTLSEDFADINDDLPAMPEWRIAKHKSQTVIASGQRLRIYNSTQLVRSEDLPHCVETLTVSNRFGRPRIIIGMSQGVIIQWLKSDEFRSLQIDKNAKNSKACFLPTGHIAIAHDDGIDVIANEGYRVSHDSNYISNRSYAAIVSDPLCFWTLTEDGLVQKWKNPATLF